MNLNLLILYLAAAIMLLGIMIKIYKEHEAIGRSLLMASFCAIGSIVGYSVNFMTDNYTAMSIGVSVNIIFQDFNFLMKERKYVKQKNTENVNFHNCVNTIYCQYHIFFFITNFRI